MAKRSAEDPRLTRLTRIAYIASRGWVALRLDMGKIDWDEVRELLWSSYAQIAPKRLAEAAKIDA